MSKLKKRHSAEFKLKAVIEILKKEKTAAQLASEYGVHPMALSKWKKHFLEHGPEIFARSSSAKKGSEEKEKADLFEQIGRLKMELEWLKKKSLIWRS